MEIAQQELSKVLLSTQNKNFTHYFTSTFVPTDGATLS